MNSETEKKLLELTKKLASLDQEISAIRGRGDKENRSAREEFLSVRDEIVNIMVDTGPIDDMRDHVARDVLRKVRDGNHYLLDIEGNRLQELFKREPEAVMAVFEKMGIKVTEEEVDRQLSETLDTFIQDILEWIDPEEYYERKRQFGAIIADNRLPEKMHGYYREIQNCFLFGQMRAVVGLCRVLLELAFRSEFTRLGLGKQKRVSNIHNLNDYRMPLVIGEVCRSRGLRSLDGKAMKLWKEASDVLHGRHQDDAISELKALDFVKRTFIVVERLYTQK